MATILTMVHKTPVCLADLNSIAGHAGLMLKLRPQSNWQQILALPADDLDHDQLQPHVTVHASGVHLVASPLTTVSQQPKHQLVDLVKLLQTTYRFSIIDLPHTLEAHQLPLLALAQKVVLFMTPDTPALQSAVAAIKFLTQHGVAPENIAPVLNQLTPANNLSAEVIQKAIRLPLLETIPYDAAMSTAIQAGQPLVLHQPKSPTSAAIAKLVKALIQ
jgi:MinD-like ATPase involved in chromosome partitioning or flagellar assembly